MRLVCIFGVVLFALATSVASADDRQFTYSEEAKTLPKGIWEFEQWATLQTDKEDGKWTTVLLREEVEYGVTDNLNLAFYYNTKYQANSNVEGFEDEHSFGFESVSFEAKYKLSDPSADVLGTLLYGEFTSSHDEYELEAKGVLSKEIGGFTFAYNLTGEWVLESEDDESPEWQWEYEISNSVGASYNLTPSFALGVEAYDISRFERSLGGDHTHAYYVGPNVHYSSDNWWATLTVLRQISVNGLEFTDDDNTKYQARLIFGINF